MKKNEEKKTHENQLQIKINEMRENEKKLDEEFEEFFEIFQTKFESLILMVSIF